MPHDVPAAGPDFHENDPRRKTREAIAAGDVDTARAWAELATAEAIHRLAKTVGREFDRPAEPTPIERGRHRHPAEQPDSTEQVA